jgi:phosphoglycerate dehydrogenase-like enzyme
MDIQIFVNSARGGIVDQDGLGELLKVYFFRKFY